MKFNLKNKFSSLFNNSERRDFTSLFMNSKNWDSITKQLNKKQESYSNSAKRKILFSVKKILDELNVKFWLVNGSALGMIRDGDFIEWDDDIDLDLYEEDYIPVFDEVLDKLINAGFIVRAVKRGPTSKMSAYLNDGNHIKIALGAIYLDGNYRKKLNRTYPKRFFEEPFIYKYRGVEFRIPGPPEEYLSYLYKNWKKPLKRNYTQKLLEKNEIPEKYK